MNPHSDTADHEADDDFGPYEPAVWFAEDYGDHGDDTPRPEW